MSSKPQIIGLGPGILPAMMLESDGIGNRDRKPTTSTDLRRRGNSNGDRASINRHRQTRCGEAGPCLAADEQRTAIVVLGKILRKIRPDIFPSFASPSTGNRGYGAPCECTHLFCHFNNSLITYHLF